MGMVNQRLSDCSPIDDSLRLPLVARYAVRFYQFHCNAYTEYGVNPFPDHIKEGALFFHFVEKDIFPYLDANLQHVQRTFTIYNQLIVRFTPFYRNQNLLDLRRKYVNALDNQHIITPPHGFLHSDHGSTAFTGGMVESRDIPRSITDHREGFLADRGQHQFTDTSGGEHLAGFRIDYFGYESILGDVHAAFTQAFASNTRPHDFRKAVIIGGADHQA